MFAISLSNICFSYNGVDDVFAGLSCTIGAGAHVAIIGDNGGGKSTLLKLISGDLRPDSGNVVTMGRVAILHQFNVCATKSGGQSQMDAIIRVFESGADILLLDEPTNNLDTDARRLFYRKVREYPGTIVIVSHDRELLNMMDSLLELRGGQINTFGGNYDFYTRTIQAQQARIESKYINTQKRIARLTYTRVVAQSMRHNHEAKQAKDKANSAKGSPIESNSLKGKSQETEAKRRKIIQKKLDSELATAQELSTQMRDDKIKIPLPNNPTWGKDVVIIENMSFGYDGGNEILSNFSLHIRGGDKVRLIGRNGCGKTTLLKIICGFLQPTSGTVRKLGRVAYLDQGLSLLDKNKTVVENISDIANIQMHLAHVIAANFGFRGDASKKLIKNLSGGELLKATLAALIGSENQPDLLILDEPTNNLDIKSTTILEDALRSYRGAVLLVSHDNIFADNVGIDNVLGI